MLQVVLSALPSLPSFIYSFFLPLCGPTEGLPSPHLRLLSLSFPLLAFVLSRWFLRLCRFSRQKKSAARAAVTRCARTQRYASGIKRRQRGGKGGEVCVDVGARWVCVRARSYAFAFLSEKKREMPRGKKRRAHALLEIHGALALPQSRSTKTPAPKSALLFGCLVS